MTNNQSFFHHLVFFKSQLIMENIKQTLETTQPPTGTTHR